MKFTIGADPEFFLADAQGKLISAIGKVAGTKWEPTPLTEVGHAVLADNVAVEFNIPPSDNAREFIDNLNYVLNSLRQNLPGYEFAQVACASFPDSELNTPDAWIFGCEPDFNAWTGKQNPRPHAEDAKLRSAGGHVHIGTDLDKTQVIRAMDLFTSRAILMDTDTKRRELYGKAGAFRPKDYGVEYRTLSNFWIWKKELIEWVYAQTQKALEFVAAGKEIPARHGAIIRKAINTGDVNAFRFLERNYAGV